MAPEQSPPPPLDPALILRARAALHAAGLPGDAISDEEVSGLVVEVVFTADQLTVSEWVDLERWWLARRSQ